MDKNSPCELDRMFTQIIQPPLVLRLAYQLKDTTGALLQHPVDFVRNSLVPGRTWFPVRFLGAVTESIKSLAAHPVQFARNALTPDDGNVLGSDW